LPPTAPAFPAAEAAMPSALRLIFPLRKVCPFQAARQFPGQTQELLDFVRIQRREELFESLFKFRLLLRK